MDQIMCVEKSSEKHKSKQLSAVAIKAFFNISSSWNLDSSEEMILLGSPGRTRFNNWKRDPSTANLSRDTLERISYILGIYKSLQILLPSPKAADEWISRENSAVIFGGRSALKRMLAGNVGDLYIVREYLDRKIERYN